MTIDTGHMKARFILIGCLAIASSLVTLYYINEQREPLKRYGISYEKDFGEHQEFQFIWFYWNKNGHRIIGPRISGEDLYVGYRYRQNAKIPDIVVQSKSDRLHFVVMRINFVDLAKPEFELLENHMIGVVYQSPWDVFYKTRANGALIGTDDKGQ
jgi:hypothetical protein